MYICVFQVSSLKKKKKKKKKNKNKNRYSRSVVGRLNILFYRNILYRNCIFFFFFNIFSPIFQQILQYFAHNSQ